MRLYSLSDTVPDIFLSPGLVDQNKVPPTFDHRALVPINEWRKVYPTVRCSTASDAFDRFSDLVVLPVGDDVLSPFRDIEVTPFSDGRSSSIPTKKLIEHCGEDSFSNLLLVLLDFIDGESLSDLQLVFQQGGNLTTTYNPITKKFTGMHFDDWCKVPLRKRGFESGLQKLMINLGTEARQFLFLPQRLEDLLADFSHVEAFSNLDVLTAVRKDNAIYSVTLLPGEAYIAPVDTLIHDGSTRGNSSVDKVLSITGSFSISALAGLNALDLPS